MFITDLWLKKNLMNNAEMHLKLIFRFPDDVNYFYLAYIADLAH